MIEEIAKNIKDEGEALLGYVPLISKKDYIGSATREIVGDELNHILTLIAIYVKLTGIRPSPDGLDEVLAFLAKDN